MRETVIKVENLGKQYMLGVIGTGTLTRDLNMWWARIRGKENPYARINQDGSMETGAHWALQAIDFEVEQGEVLGIIGKNGAGKSTLLKILSRVTTPTSGSIKIKGRIASLLEVGTGFHPELTGRENIFLNGAILGMSKPEIRNKFDEIVDFSGIGKYIDTPVKRYSSGMYVRLAFAVAAFLEPEILIVDEVLAVGDIEFQKKCLGKMHDVSEKEGRTVLFVSHNMAAVKSLCTRAMLLNNGRMEYSGNVYATVEKYIEKNISAASDGTIPEGAGIGNIGKGRFTRSYITNDQGQRVSELYFKQPFNIHLELDIRKALKNTLISVMITSAEGEAVAYAAPTDVGYRSLDLEPGHYAIDVAFDVTLLPKHYSLNVGLVYFSTGETIDYVERSYEFNVSNLGVKQELTYPWDTVHGYVEPKTEWTISKQ